VSQHVLVAIDQSLSTVYWSRESNRPLYVCVCIRTLTFELSNLWPRYSAWRAGSPWPCLGQVRRSRSYVIRLLHGHRLTNVPLSDGCT